MYACETEQKCILHSLYRQLIIRYFIMQSYILAFVLKNMSFILWWY